MRVSLAVGFCLCDYATGFVPAPGKNHRLRAASIDNLPGPKTSTINAASQNGNGSAFTNLSGSLKMLDAAGKSAVRYATVIERKISNAMGREAKPTIKSNPPMHSSVLIK